MFVLNTQHTFITNSWVYPNTSGPIPVNPATQLLVLSVPLRYVQMAIVDSQVFLSLQCACVHACTPKPQFGGFLNPIKSLLWSHDNGLFISALLNSGFYSVNRPCTLSSLQPRKNRISVLHTTRPAATPVRSVHSGPAVALYFCCRQINLRFFKILLQSLIVL